MLAKNAPGFGLFLILLLRPSTGWHYSATLNSYKLVLDLFFMFRLPKEGFWPQDVGGGPTPGVGGPWGAADEGFEGAGEEFQLTLWWIIDPEL